MASVTKAVHHKYNILRQCYCLFYSNFRESVDGNPIITEVFSNIWCKS